MSSAACACSVHFAPSETGINAAAAAVRLTLPAHRINSALMSQIAWVRALSLSYVAHRHTALKTFAAGANHAPLSTRQVRTAANAWTPPRHCHFCTQSDAALDYTFQRHGTGIWHVGIALILRIYGCEVGWRSLQDGWGGRHKFHKAGH